VHALPLELPLLEPLDEELVLLELPLLELPEEEPAPEPPDDPPPPPHAASSAASKTIKHARCNMDTSKRHLAHCDATKCPR
jgi:hypothetical protein